MLGKQVAFLGTEGRYSASYPAWDGGEGLQVCDSVSAWRLLKSSDAGPGVGQSYPGGGGVARSLFLDSALSVSVPGCATRCMTRALCSQPALCSQAMRSVWHGDDDEGGLARSQAMNLHALNIFLSNSFLYILLRVHILP